MTETNKEYLAVSLWILLAFCLGIWVGWVFKSISYEVAYGTEYENVGDLFDTKISKDCNKTIVETENKSFVVEGLVSGIVGKPVKLIKTYKHCDDYYEELQINYGKSHKVVSE